MERGKKVIVMVGTKPEAISYKAARGLLRFHWSLAMTCRKLPNFSD